MTMGKNIIYLNHQAVFAQLYNRTDLPPHATTEEELSLAKRVRQGDEEALPRLCDACIRFVVSVAFRFQYKGLTMEELIAEGNKGLKEACMYFDFSGNIKFISFAVMFIRRNIIQAINSQSEQNNINN